LLKAFRLAADALNPLRLSAHLAAFLCRFPTHGDVAAYFTSLDAVIVPRVAEIPTGPGRAISHYLIASLGGGVSSRATPARQTPFPNPPHPAATLPDSRFVSAAHRQVSLSFMVMPPTIEVANLGMADSLILMVMALVVFGPRRLPEIGRQIGKLMYEFRKASNDFKFQMEEELRNAEEADRRKKEEEDRQRQLAANPPAQLEAGSATTVETPAAVEAPYSYGGTYGEIAEAKANAASDAPKILPPSTGEPVPAAKSESEGIVEAPANSAIAVAEHIPVATETAAEDTNKTTEPAHNG
jgi:sec-independent protein translocase protein TatB